LPSWVVDAVTFIWGKPLLDELTTPGGRRCERYLQKQAPLSSSRACHKAALHLLRPNPGYGVLAIAGVGLDPFFPLSFCLSGNLPFGGSPLSLPHILTVVKEHGFQKVRVGPSWSSGEASILTSRVSGPIDLFAPSVQGVFVLRLTGGQHNKRIPPLEPFLPNHL
jgi:hypothetical protein